MLNVIKSMITMDMRRMVLSMMKSMITMDMRRIVLSMIKSMITLHMRRMVLSMMRSMMKFSKGGEVTSRQMWKRTPAWLSGTYTSSGFVWTT